MESNDDVDAASTTTAPAINLLDGVSVNVIFDIYDTIALASI